MTEIEYIAVSNEKKLTSALLNMHGVLGGEESGINHDELLEIKKSITELQNRCSRMYKISS